MKMTSKIKCECGSIETISYKKPTYLLNEVGTKVCDACGSRIYYNVRRSKIKGQSEIAHGVIDPSDDLLLIRLEEKAAKYQFSDDSLSP